MFAALVLLAQLAATAETTPPTIVEPERLELTAEGICTSGSRTFRMDELMVLENRTLVVRMPAGRTKVQIGGDDVTVEILDDADTAYAVYSMRSLIDDEGNLDLQTKLALYDAQVVLYWRETFQNRSYRQGLVAIEGEKLKPLCEGRGGWDVDR